MSLRAKLRGFGGDTSGATLVYVGVMLTALLGFGALAVDGAQLYVAKTRLQVVADAASLAAAKELPDVEKAKAAALAVAQANLPQAQNGDVMTAANIQIGNWDPAKTPQFDPNRTPKNAVRATALRSSANGNALSLTLASMFGPSATNLGSEAIAIRGSDLLEVALVLDNTKSMGDDGKIAALRTAAADLVDTLTAGVDPSDPDAVRIAVVPFAQAVRVDPKYRTAAWMNQGTNQTGNDYLFNKAVNRFDLFDKMGIAWAGCLEGRPLKDASGKTVDYDVTDAVANLAAPASLFVPYFAPDEPGDAGDTAWNDDEVDNSYLPDSNGAGNNGNGNGNGGGSNGQGNWANRQAHVDKYGKTGLNTNGDRGPNRGCGMEKITPLTTNYAGVKTSIGKMTAVGSTNIPMGLMWGWHTLSPDSPFAGEYKPRPYKTPKSKKIAVLMTDGENTYFDFDNPNKSKYTGLGYIVQERLGVNGGDDAARTKAMDARLKKLCKNMKDQDIVIYTVSVKVKEDTAKMMKDCATSSKHAFDVSDNAGMKKAFEDIALSIGNLRLVR